MAWGGAFARVGFVLEDGSMGVMSLSGKGSLFLAWLLYIILVWSLCQFIGCLYIYLSFHARNGFELALI